MVKGARPTTIKDIAAHLGIAFSTVSRALNDQPHVSEALKERVRRAAAELGYVPNAGARLMHKASNQAIGLLIPDVENQLFGNIAKVFAEHCAQAGYALILSVSGDDPQMELRQVEAFREARVAAIAIASCGKTLDATRRLLEMGPVLQLAERDPSLRFPVIRLDDEKAIYRATHHLLQLGHERIAFIGGRSYLGTASRRLEGYEHALKEAGLPVDRGNIFQGPLTSEFGALAVSQLLQRNSPPTAAVVGNSLQTEGVIDGLRAAGIMPPVGFSLVGHGDPSWFRLWGPGITTIDTRTKEIADISARWLLSHIDVDAGTGDNNPNEEPMRFILEANIVQRGSTAPPEILATSIEPVSPGRRTAREKA